MRYFVNPVFILLTIVLLFLVAAIGWMLLDAQFLALSLILIYVGTLTVLLLFIIMYLKPKSLIIFNLKSFIMALGIAGIFSLIIEDYKLLVPIIINNNNAYLLGQELFTNYLIQVLIAGMLLLSIIVLTVGQHSRD